MEQEDSEHEDVLTPAMQTAISSHEMYTALRNAGFSRNEALTIVVGMLTANSGGGD